MQTRAISLSKTSLKEMSQSKVLLLILSLVLTHCCVQAFDSKESVDEWDDFHWLVSVTNRCPINFLVGGSLISKHAVLTASEPIQDLNVRLLEVIIEKRSWNESMGLSVRSVVHHPNFNLTTMADNLALLFLKKPIEFTSQIAPINLATPTSLRNLDLTSCIAEGWKKLRVSTATCERKLEDTGLLLNDSLMCAGGGTERHFCPRDGDPFVCPLARDPSQFQLVGILYGFPHCMEFTMPYVFTNVVKAHGWINQQIGLNPYIEGPADEDNEEIKCPSWMDWTEY